MEYSMKTLATCINTLEIGYEVYQFRDENDLLHFIALSTTNAMALSGELWKPAHSQQTQK